MRWSWLETAIGLAGVWVASTAACSSPSSGSGGAETTSGDPPSSSGDPEGGPTTSGSGSGGATSITGLEGVSRGGAPDEEPCAAQVRRGETIPLDMFIMMDRSGSMLGEPADLFGGGSPNLWVPIGEALGTFVTLPEAAGIGAGIQFFPLNNDSCDVNVYGQAAAPIAELPGNGPPIQQAIINNGPDQGGRTPTLPALQGAIQHASAWAQSHPGTKVIVVLATDGEPNICNSTVGAVAQAATDGVNGTPPIETYVIGIGNIAGLNQIAAAGDPAGARQALIVDVNPNVASQQFLDAMNAIRGDASLPCEFQLPPPPADEELAFDEVNVKFSLPMQSPQELFYVEDAANCASAGGGWYYDNAASPSAILLCESTCMAVKSQAEAQVDLEVGCARREKVPE